MSTELFDNIPSEMKSLPRWVCHEVGKKAPMDAKKLGLAGSSTNSATWAPFEVAAERVKKGNYAGLGFVLNGDGLVAVDIDHCINDGIPDTKAVRFLQELGATYIEISMSGTGLHAYGYGEMLEKGCKGTIDGLSVELYSSARFMIVTGRVISATKKLSALKGFKDLAERLRPENAIGPEDADAPIEHQAKHNELIRRIITGEVFHDSLRDLAASYISSGMAPGQAVTTLRALMEQSSEKNTERWEKRYKQIPELVESARIKFTDFNIEEKFNDALSSGETKFKLLTSEDLADLAPSKWLIKGVLPAEGLAVIYGPSGSGKSFLALDMCAAIAEGTRWFGHRTEQAPVVYLALEGEGGVKNRVKAWEKHQSRKLNDEMRMVLQPFKISDASDLAELSTAIKKFHSEGAVVVIDTLNRAAPTADENSSKDMGMIIEGAKLLQSKLGGLCILVHHSGKDQSKGMRGHSSLFAALDSAIEVARDGSKRFWAIAKSKDGDDNLKHSFDLDVVHLSDDDDGDPVTSCIVDPKPISGSSSSPHTLNNTAKLALETFYEAAKSLPSVDDAADISIHLKDWRPIFYKRSTADNADAKRKAFDRARKELVNAEILSVDDDIYTSLELASSLMSNDW